MAIAIQAESLSKIYRYYARPFDRMIEAVVPKKRHAEIRALDEVSLDIEQGSITGLVGRNGAGKSTLLKILAGVVTPTSGTVSVAGKVSAILELGTGFHPEFTGRANAELSAAITGLSPDEIRERMPAILEFADLGSFIDQPVRTYSSGMVVRLGFSVAVHVDPAILLVDEALAVGDGNFQKKCLDRMRQFQERQRTILFCSHSLAAISSICPRTIWMDRGRVRMYGPSPEVLRAYEAELLESAQEIAAAREDVLAERPSSVRLRSIELSGLDGAPRREFDPGESVVVRLTIESLEPDEAFHVVAGIDRMHDQLQCATFGTHWDGLEAIGGKGAFRIELVIRDVTLTPAEYSLMIFVGDRSALHVFDRGETTFRIRGIGDPGFVFEAGHEWLAPRGA
jgi:ABC-type polysaccharide/polyol phosphate transport system ATPase subunit